jgi:DNA-binding response OmpR family regulator
MSLSYSFKPRFRGSAKVREMNNNFKDRVLIVDDEAAITSVVKKFLESIGIHDVDECTNLGCFDDFFAPGKYHMVIVDMHLGENPTVSGFDVIKTIRSQDQEALILVVTGYPAALISEELINSGIDDFLLKPLKLETFAYRVLLNLARAHRHRRFDLSIRNRYDERIETLKKQAGEITEKLSYLLLGGENAAGNTRPCQGVG